jgi:hypothetical protein
MPPTALWLFAHRGLSSMFHEDPHRFVEVLDGGGAPGFLERMWTWAREAAGVTTSATKPPLSYALERPRPGLAVIYMQFREVTTTGEPWFVRFFVRDPDPGQSNGYTRMFLLEHSEYASELAGSPTAIVCESCSDGSHRNWSVTVATADEAGFDKAVVETLRSGASPAATVSRG